MRGYGCGVGNPQWAGGMDRREAMLTPTTRVLAKLCEFESHYLHLIQTI